MKMKKAISWMEVLELCNFVPLHSGIITNRSVDMIMTFLLIIWSFQVLKHLLRLIVFAKLGGITFIVKCFCHFRDVFDFYYPFCAPAPAMYKIVNITC